MEVIVVDDGSTDATPEIVESFGDRITFIRQPNEGVGAARNRGIQHAKGDVIALLDHDDEWYPEKIATQLVRLVDGVVAVGSLLHYVNEKDAMFGVSGELADNRRQDIRAARFMPFAPSSMIVRREDVVAIGGFDEALSRRVMVDDLDLLSRLADAGEVVTVMEPLGRYRIHSHSSSATDFYRMQYATRFLMARRASADILTWEEFDRTYRPKRGERRRELGRYLYRSAGVSITSDRLIRGSLTLASALLVSPIYTVRRLRRQRRGGVGSGVQEMNGFSQGLPGSI